MIRQIRAEADALIKTDAPFKKLVWIHAAVTVGINMLLQIILTVLNTFTPAAGIQNLHSNAIVSTIRVVVQLTFMFSSYLWSCGLMATALKQIRKEPVSVASLCEGFPRFLPLLVCLFVRLIMCLPPVFLAIIVTSVSLAFLPSVQAAIGDPASLASDPGFLIPCMLMLLISFILLVIPVVYHYRQSEYCLFDEKAKGGFMSTHLSRVLMHQNRWRLFLLDLSFWWYEAAGILVSLAYALLAQNGIPGVDPVISQLLAYALNMLLQLGLYGLAMPKISVCRALFYQKLVLAYESAQQLPATDTDYNE